MIVFAIDPGTTESAFVIWDGQKLWDKGFISNEDACLRLMNNPHPVAIEMVACYGMPVGKEVFETCVWIGRFIERAGACDPRKVYRRDIKLHLCQSARAKDGNVRQALIDKHGPCGTKKAPGKLYGISGHLWAALAVADYALSTQPNP